MSGEGLQAALAGLTEALREQGAPVVAQLARDPGYDVARALSEVGLPAPEGVTSWWLWAGPAPPPDLGWSRFITPRHRLIALDRAVGLYREFIDPADPWLAPMAQPGWLPLAQFEHGGLLVADCRGEQRATVAKVWNAESGVGGSGADLTAAVAWWTGHLRAGRWAWRDGAWEDRLHGVRLPPDQDASHLV